VKILERRALRGPNYYSRYLTIFIRLDIEGLEERPSDTVPGIVERLTEVMPSIQEHRCSVGRPGGFLERLGRGTWAGHVVEHVAIELQNLVGFSVGYGKTLDTDEVGIYNVLYRYRDEATGLAAGVEAVDIVERLFEGQEIDLQAALDRLKEVREAHMLGPSTASIVDAAKARDIPYYRLSENSSYIQLGHGAKQKRFQATVTQNTSLIGHGIADDKDWTKQILGDAGIPVPRGQICYSLEEAVAAAEWLGYPVAVKPLVGNHGRGVSTNITDAASLREAYDAAYHRYAEVIVETYIPGEDHRLLVVGGKLIAAARRRKAHVVGDGTSTLHQLVDAANQDPRRGVGHEKVLTRIELDEQSHRLIAQQGWTLTSRIPKGEIVYLKSTANLSTGGTATDVTDEVHPEVRYAAERISRLIGLDIIGIDLLAETLTRPLAEQAAGVVEVNAGPGFRMHTAPTEGQGREVGTHVVDMLFPDGGDARVPITAVTGTNGKTTTTRLIAHTLRQAGQQVGLACTGGIEIDNHVIARGDYSGPESAKTVLREPTVEQAVLEVARGGIMRRGLGFDACDVGVMLNIASDHLGEHDIHNLDDLARCKSVIIDAIKPGGTAVLNADDPRCLDAREWARGNVVLFSLNPQARAVRQHVRDQGVAFVLADERVVMRQGHVDAEILPVADVPLTFDGRAKFNIANALAAAAACHGLGLTLADIRMGLQTFHPTPGQLPGRSNLIDSEGVRAIIDYGHNVPALIALDQLVANLPARRRIAVTSAPGNRRDEDLAALGEQIGRMHDVVFVCETAPRGREVGEAAGLLRAGAESTLRGGGRVEVIHAERDAVAAALDEACQGDLLVLLVDETEHAIHALKSRKFKSPAPSAAP